MTTRPVHSLYIALADPRPPSVNHLYVNGFRGRRVLSKEGHAFKAALTQAVAAECMARPWKEAIDTIYRDAGRVRLTIGLHLPILNKSWKPGGVTEKGAPQSPYKKLDGTNYIKAIEDAAVAGTGIDDSAYLSVTVEKIHDEHQFIELVYEVLK